MNDVEIFDPNDYPTLTVELAAIAEQTKHLCLPQKGQIIVSFLKDRCIHKRWFNGYQALVILMMSEKIKATFTEMLLKSHNSNNKFKQDMESYMITVLK